MSKEGLRVPRVRIIGSCDLPDMDAGTEIGHKHEN